MSSEERAQQPSAAARAAAQQLFATALRHHQAGQLAEAETLYRQILADQPFNIDCLHLLGVIAHQQGRNDLAIDLIGRAIGLNDEVAGFHNNIGEAYRALGRLEDASRHYRRAIAIEPEFAEAHMNLANVLKQQHKWADAEAAYAQALRLKPDYVEAHMNLGVALMDQGKLDDAAACYRQALALKGDFAPAVMNLGIVFQQRGEDEDAEAHYRRALALMPNYMLAHSNLGDLLFEQGKIVEAVACYEQALRISTGRGPEAGVTDPADRIAAFAPGRLLLQVEDKAVMGLVRAQSWRSPVSEWQRICDAALGMPGLWPPSQYELLVRKTIHRWMEYDYLGMSNTTQQSAVVNNDVDVVNPNVKNSRAYARYLRNLDRHVDRRPELRPKKAQFPLVPIVGDSHSLAFDGVALKLDGVSYTGRAELVMGCKAWHLAKEIPNRYKWLFETIVGRLPPRSAALLSFGEIDCRLDEGILPHWRKVGGDVEGLVRDLAEKYVGFAAGVAARRELRLRFIGVPAPHVDAFSLQNPSLTAEDKALLIRIIGLFNRFLEETAKAKGHAYVDLYRLSAGPDGKATGEWHLDDYHLKPDALALALG